tara:strand:- start:3330 stop:3779 length:450 start_codon:yes stop_codon:yes gene_type:complete
MKKSVLLISTVLMATLFIAATHKEAPQSTVSLEGVWELEHQYLYDNNEILDTLYNLNGYRQVKMYSKGKVMWTRFNPVDNNEWFGYGSYEIKDGILEERLEYASNAMMQIVDTVQVFKFELILGNNTYSQITLDERGNKYNAENYVRIE